MEKVIEKSCVLFCDKKLLQRVPFSEMRRNFGEPLNDALKHITGDNVCVGLLMEKNFFLPLLIESLRNLGHCFMFLNSQNRDKAVNFLQLKWIISYNTESIEHFQIFSCVELSHNIDYKMWRTKKTENPKCDLDFSGIFCVMMTSGSTGENKFVRIPYSCIENNVKCLQEEFKVTSEDIILWTTPLTFDPSLVELLLFRYAQASILFTSEITFLNPGYLLDVLLDNKVTFVQMVPSVFFRWNSIQIEKLLNNSSLHVLSFGGEPFPKSIFNYKRNSEIRLYNLYGVTELSCWASIYKIKNEKCEDDIPVGEPIGESYLEVRDSDDNIISEGTGEICVGNATRFCLVNRETRSNVTMPIRSGDLAKINNKGIIYQGRKHRIVKRFGQKVNLSKIEETIFKEIELQSRSVFSDGKILLFILIKEHFNATSKEKLLDKVRVKMLNILPPQDFPDFIEILSNFPLSNHGKICDRTLEKYYSHYSRNKTSAVEDFDRLCSTYFGTDDETVENIYKFTFTELGANSVVITQFLAELSHKLGTDLPPDFVSILFEKPLDDCKVYLESFKFAVKRKLDKENNSREEHGKIEILDVVWKYDLKACVDCSPLAFEFEGKILIAVGSFANIFVILDEDGKEYLKLNLPDNIEATPCVSTVNGFIFIGCYDGNMYCIDLTKKKIRWQYRTLGKIKSRPSNFKNDEAIVFGSYDNCVCCVCQKIGSEIWKVNLHGSVSSNIMCFKNKIFVATLKGLCYSLNEDGNILWSYDVKVPLFGTHCFLEGAVVWPDVTGILHCTSISDGSLLWKYRMEGRIFSSLTISENQIYVACQDTIYQLVLSDPIQKSPKVLRKFKLRSEVSTTPFVYETSTQKFLICLSNSGHFYVVNATCERMIFEGKLPNQCFSSPFVLQGCVYVGCRDNFLYKIKLNIM